LVPSYINNTDTFFLPGGGRAKYQGNTSTTPFTPPFAAANVGWDYTVGPADVGLTSNDPDQLPLIISTGSTITYGTVNTAAAATGTLTAAVAGTAPFGTSGVAVGFKNMSSAFYNAKAVGTAFPISSVSLTPVQVYVQLTP
jgi:hypothetical protein